MSIRASTHERRKLIGRDSATAGALWVQPLAAPAGRFHFVRDVVMPPSA